MDLDLFNEFFDFSGPYYEEPESPALYPTLEEYELHHEPLQQIHYAYDYTPAMQMPDDAFQMIPFDFFSRVDYVYAPSETPTPPDFTLFEEPADEQAIEDSPPTAKADPTVQLYEHVYSPILRCLLDCLQHSPRIVRWTHPATLTLEILDLDGFARFCSHEMNEDINPRRVAALLRSFGAKERRYAGIVLLKYCPNRQRKHIYQFFNGHNSGGFPPGEIVNKLSYFDFVADERQKKRNGQPKQRLRRMSH
ncbi:hypothetical protein QR680_004460 [Steinernema hermaphroditum]|uniref:Uncharacterized protein n=1 Tax=Steinernema hermaphroditum TaxID=289476 RepID=A0AA39HNS4_9BILA|nr:hypothetical protein QR680_004460 [Steinernema hermaphroditum]